MLSDNEFRNLLSYFNRPWAGFRKVRKGVKKRIRRHMQTLGCTTVAQYLIELEGQPESMAAANQCLRVTISRFFRDRQLWQVLKKRILPCLARQFTPPIRIWSAGCAGGEEPYSLAILWRELERPATLDLLGTDADEICLSRARKGIYSRSSLKEVPDAIQSKYFDRKRGGRQFLVNFQLLEPIQWRRHDLLNPPPGNDFFHMILLRNNLLTYYTGGALQKAYEQIIARIVPGGYLVIGAHEKVHDSVFHLNRDDECRFIYQLAHK
jgi:chemotaxis methyl-accepting protein methylase